MRISLLLAIATVGLWGLSVQAQNQKQSKLLPGRYVYLGKQAGSSPPKYMVVNDDGAIFWEGNANPSPMRLAPVHSFSIPDDELPPPPDPPQKPKGEFETYEYPFIKWKPKMLSGGAVLQLETTLEDNGISNHYAHVSVRLKYKVRVLVRGNALLPSQGVHLELLDDRGFGLCNFIVQSASLGLIAGTSVMEARGITNMTEDDYRKAVDYTAK